MKARRKRAILNSLCKQYKQDVVENGFYKHLLIELLNNNYKHNGLKIITSPLQIETSKITTHYSEYPKYTYYGFNNQSQHLFNKENN